MNPKKRRRLAFAIAIVLAGAGTAALILFALQDNVNYFYDPTEVAAKHVAPGVYFRTGGLVQSNSLKQGAGVDVAFIVTDGKASIPVQYHGVLPALFREGQGVIVAGHLTPAGVFIADDNTGVVAKHDEKYMPPEVVDALKKSGRWKEGE